MRARAMVMMAANGGQSQHQNIIINTGNESMMMAPAVVTSALHSIKERSRAAHCRKHDACTPDGDDGILPPVHAQGVLIQGAEALPRNNKLEEIRMEKNCGRATA